MAYNIHIHHHHHHAASAACSPWTVCCQVDRAPTGSGVTARVAVQYARGQLDVGQTRLFQSAATGIQYSGTLVKALEPGGHQTDHAAVVVEVSGTAYYTGNATYTADDDDELKQGFLLR